MSSARSHRIARGLALTVFSVMVLLSVADTVVRLSVSEIEYYGHPISSLTNSVFGGLLYGPMLLVTILTVSVLSDTRWERLAPLTGMVFASALAAFVVYLVVRLLLGAWYRLRAGGNGGS